MPGPRLSAPEEGWSQQSNRSPGIFFDQHKSPRHPAGRPWWCWTETPANPKHPRGIVGELIPIVADLDVGGEIVQGWLAPWVPEQKYVVRSIGLLAGGNSFKIDYVSMISDYRQANERYYRLAASTAGAKNWPAPRMYGPVEFQLRAIVGDPPKSPKLPEAAAAGDPWLLGFSTHVNEQLRTILDRETGRMHVPMDEDEPIVPPAPKADASLLASLSDEDMAELSAFLKQRKQAAHMRDAKKKSSPSDQAA
jgi:hypothetical protein